MEKHERSRCMLQDMARIFQVIVGGNCEQKSYHTWQCNFVCSLLMLGARASVKVGFISSFLGRLLAYLHVAGCCRSNLSLGVCLETTGELSRIRFSLIIGAAKRA